MIGRMSDQLGKVAVMEHPITGLSSLPPLDRAGDVVRSISEFIAGAGLEPGDRLPTERQLMQTLAVGRSTIREAQRKLQSLGVLETRRGSGTYLLRKLSRNAIHVPLVIDAPSLRSGLLQTLEIRRALEIEAGALAAQKRTAADIYNIELKLIEMERVHLTKGTANREDLEFHLSIYQASQNPLFNQILEQMREAFESFWNRPFDRPDFGARSFPLHRLLFNAVRDQMPEEARRITSGILQIVEEDIMEMVK